MKIKLIMLALCFILIVATDSCNKFTPEIFGGTRVYVSDTSVYFYYSDAFSKNRKQELILVFWDNLPISGQIESSWATGNGPTDMTCRLTRSNSTVEFKCVGKLEKKTGKGTVKIAGKTFDVSNGRLFLINTRVNPLKVIQVNEQFNLPPFNDLSFLPPPLKRPISKKAVMARFSALSSFEKKFEYLAKNNKEVAAFLAQSKDKQKTPSGKK